MSSLPSQHRISQSRSGSEPRPSAPSRHSFTSSEDSNAVPNGHESFVDLSSVGQDQQSTDSETSGVLVAAEKKKCWVCLAEEGETLPDGTPVNTSRWSKACACSLDAHESCLITWINQSRGSDTNKIVSNNITGK